MTKGQFGCAVFVILFVLLLIGAGFLLFSGAATIGSWFAWDWWNDDTDTVIVETPVPGAPADANTGTSDPALAGTGTGTAPGTTPVPASAPQTGTMPLGTASGTGTVPFTNLTRRVFVCRPEMKTPIYPERLDAGTSTAIRKDLKIPSERGIVGYRFRFPNPASALGVWSMQISQNENPAYDEEVLVIGVTPTRICLGPQNDFRRHHLVLPKDASDTCNDRNGNPVVGSRIVTACQLPNGSLLTYGDLYLELNRSWRKSEKLGVWTMCDQDGRRPDSKSGYPGACRPAGDLVVETGIR